MILINTRHPGKYIYTTCINVKHVVFYLFDVVLGLELELGAVIVVLFLLCMNNKIRQ
jgi:hypothetical protein